MAKEPQTPLDDELARREQEPETPEQEAEERLAEGELESLIDDEGDTIDTADDNPEAQVLAAQVEELEQSLAKPRIKPCARLRKHRTSVGVPSRKPRKHASLRWKNLSRNCCPWWIALRKRWKTCRKKPQRYTVKVFP